MACMCNLSSHAWQAAAWHTSPCGMPHHSQPDGSCCRDGQFALGIVRPGSLTADVSFCPAAESDFGTPLADVLYFPSLLATGQAAALEDAVFISV